MFAEMSGMPCQLASPPFICSRLQKDKETDRSTGFLIPMDDDRLQIGVAPAVKRHPESARERHEDLPPLFS
jgi:hypothetical protein